MLRSCSFAHRSVGAGVQTALWDANLCVREGECVVIEGPSGSGKSTLLGLILRLFDPENGRLSLSGRAYRDWPVHELRRQFAVMRQETHLFAGTIRDALQFGVGARSDADLHRVLRRVALGDLVDSAPAGLDAPLGEDAGNLSGGQRARLALARALLADRPVLLLDEPFANVDPESRATLIDGAERRARRAHHGDRDSPGAAVWFRGSDAAPRSGQADGRNRGFGFCCEPRHEPGAADPCKRTWRPRSRACKPMIRSWRCWGAPRWTRTYGRLNPGAARYATLVYERGGSEPVRVDLSERAGSWRYTGSLVRSVGRT